MQIQDIMTREVEVIHPEATLREAAEKMRDLNVGSLPVCDGDRLYGMITDRDITVRATAEGRDPSQTTVNNTMTPDVLYCYEDQDVSAAAEIMRERQIRRLPVLNRDKRLVGILAIGDLAVDTGNERLVGETLAGVSRPAKPDR